MLRHLLLITILATIALANAQGDAEPRALGVTVSCSAGPSVAGCYLERRVLSLADLEVTVGVDAQLAWRDDRTSHLAPYAGVAWYAAWGSIWAEFALPSGLVPVIGRPDAWRVGFTLTL